MQRRQLGGGLYLVGTVISVVVVGLPALRLRVGCTANHPYLLDGETEFRPLHRTGGDGPFGLVDSFSLPPIPHPSLP